MKKRHVLTKYEQFINEVRYLNTNYPSIKNEEPLKDNENIRVFHGFNKFDDVEKVLTKGLSGKEKARRIYSYESGNNPYGLFVSVNFDILKLRGFARSGVIIEFTSKVSDLEAPVWVDGRSYFVQGEYTKSFKDLDEREQQRLINRQTHNESPYDYIKKSDRSELAQTIFENPEKQALYVGDLDPNMIKYVWYNEVLYKERKTNGKWVRMTRKEFIKKLNIDTSRRRFFEYLPNENFVFSDFVDKYYNGDYDNIDLKYFVQNYLLHPDKLARMDFYPKQIKQIKKLKEEDVFDKWLKQEDEISESASRDKDREVLFVDEHSKNIVYDNGSYRIAVNDVNNANYITLWYLNNNDWKKVGTLDASTNDINVKDRNGKYLSIRTVDIDKKHRGLGYGYKLYKALFDFSNDDIKGIYSYLPNRANKKQVPKIYKRFGSDNNEDYDFIDFEN